MEPMSRRLLCVGLLAALAGAAVAAEPLEYAVKAAYLVKFPFYVDWPPTAFATPTAPLNLCVIGEDPFGSLLDDAAAGQQVQGHPLAVRRMKNAMRDAGCHIVYLGADVRPDAMRGNGSLLVTDASASGSGVINFVVKDNRVRFTVDDELAAQNGLAISSKLLNVALSVKPRGSR